MAKEETTPVVYPTIETVKKEIDEKTEVYRTEMRHLRSLLRVLHDRENSKQPMLPGM